MYDCGLVLYHSSRVRLYDCTHMQLLKDEHMQYRNACISMYCCTYYWVASCCFNPVLSKTKSKNKGEKSLHFLTS